ncbi:LOW QUALITY PROTEIN: hypothetical protein OSB04_025575 [Centaurea solstitialis]|uniref:Uncharacterized protein n=1 Tax=Centaurea solstitialis TaxID=347529 RepID=A0AA38SVW8_9ASTR|nr:LOW QUALITY PROTEIN: hypothetical protein OSB04_025575 [Centaurea solstitialis]
MGGPESTLGKSGLGHAFELKDPALDDLLPEGVDQRQGFGGEELGNTREILRHGSVGGFMCHCGWNSVLEAMHAGVVLVTWLLYAEQKMNRVHLVEGIKVALRLKMSEDGFVTAEELAERLKELMEKESGKKIRDHVSDMSKFAKAAVGDGGSSRVSLAEFVDSLKSVQNLHCETEIRVQSQVLVETQNPDNFIKRKKSTNSTLRTPQVGDSKRHAKKEKHQRNNQKEKPHSKKQKKERKTNASSWESTVCQLQKASQSV